MIPIKDKSFKFPMKIGDESRVVEYAKTLVNGEEQLLLTRNGKMYLTNGAGGFLEYKFNNIYDSTEIDEKMEEEIKKIVDTIDKLKADSLNEFTSLSERIDNNKKDFEDALDVFKNDTNASISIIEESVTLLVESLDSVIGNIEDIHGDIKQDNIVGTINSLYELTIAGKRSIVNAINTIMPSFEASLDNTYDELSEMITNIQTSSGGSPSIPDFGYHTSLPSFSKHPRLKIFTAGG